MYLVIFDKFIIDNKNKSYYLSVNENYNKLCEIYPNINNVKKEDIDEILIYSKATSDGDKNAKIAQCSNIEFLISGVKIYYDQIESIEYDCEGIRKRLYGYLKSHNLLKPNENTNAIYALDDINDYTYIKGEKKVVKFASEMMRVEQLINENKWNEAVAVFGDLRDIEKSIYWNDEYCLSKLSFILSMLVTTNIKSPNDERFWGKYFLKVNDRVLELSPNKSSELSLRAYYYYSKYLHRQIDTYYDEAVKIYQSIIEQSPESYKEKYRYTKLRQKRFESKEWLGEFGEKWYQSVQEILLDYQKLIENYETLEPEAQIHQKKYYIKSLFSYASFAIDYLFKFWEDYIANRIYGREVKDYKFSEKRQKEMINTKKYLDKICEISDYEHLGVDQIISKPSYFDVEYRIAQIYQNMGLLLILSKAGEEDYNNAFNKSNQIIDELLSVANKYKENRNIHFNYPNYVKLPKAINLYLLKKYDECHICFKNCKDYMKYEEARIYMLTNETDKAKMCLNSISSKDKVFNKAQKLLKKLENENK